MKRRPSRTRRAAVTTDPAADPFGERRAGRYRFSADLFGARFHFTSDTRDLLDVARAACPAGSVGLARGASRQELTIGLRLHAAPTLGRAATPPAPVFSAAAGLVTTCIDRGNHAAVAPLQYSALVVMSPDMLRFRYHARYELVEFALYTLATRALGLVPLHAACVAEGRSAWLLLGASGAGKTTVATMCAMAGLGLQSEDIVFFDPRTGQLHALPRYLHLHRAALALLRDRRVRQQVAMAPLIRRRGGARKLEVDLDRQRWCHTVDSARLRGVVLLQAGSARTGSEPRRLMPARLRARLVELQAQAVDHDGWPAFLRHAGRLPAFELARDEALVTSLVSLIRSRSLR